MTEQVNDKPTAIVLGGTKPHIELICKLKNRGFYVCLIDYLTNPPGAAYADEHLIESTLDMDKVQAIAVEKEATLVISACIDQANSTCCYVAERLNLPHPYSYQTSLDVTNKGRMKKVFVENEIPTSMYRLFREADIQMLDNITFPAVVKPVDCNSSKGVYRVNSIEEARRYLEEAIAMSRENKAIMEGFNFGPEIQVDCFALNDGAKVVMTRQKKKIRNEKGMVLQSYGSVVPAPLSKELEEQAADIACRIARAFHLKNTPFFYQGIVTEEGIRVLEFAPRIGGGLSYYLIKTVTGFDPIEAVIKSFLGEPMQIDIKPADKCYATNLLYMNPGTFDHIEGFEKLKEEKVIKESFVLKNKGDTIDSDMRSGNRVGAFVVDGNSYGEVDDKTEAAFSRIEIFDTYGENVLNRNAYK